MNSIITDNRKKTYITWTMSLSLRSIACLLSIYLFSGATTALADDTEIYTGAATFASGVQPNLVFIIDSSGSMDTDVTLTTGSYDSTTTYTGDCDSDKVYWSSNGTPPNCDGGGGGRGGGSNGYILVTANTCSASYTALSTAGVGFYVTRAARFRSRRGEDRWSTLSNSDHDDLVECEDDWGVHGQTDISTDIYPADENDSGPWRSNTSNAINWNDTGDTYTFYSANYLNWRSSPGVITTKTRLEIVQEVFSDLMESVSNINLAVMRFDKDDDGFGGDSTDGGYFIMPMQPLTDANRTAYKTAVNDIVADGSTPLAETLYESYLYYKGASVDSGDSSEPAVNVSGVLDPDDTSKYKTPVEYQCQKNFVILLTDGEPTSDTGADSNIEGMTGFSAVTGGATCTGNCLDELADYMYQKDCSSLDDTQNIITYTIGFATDQALLSNAATKGGGKYYTADDTAGLTDAFTSILTEILAINTTFIAPAITVNAFNRFNHREELYYALFKPSARPKWNGNVKRFKLAGNPAIIVDANDEAAIDDNTGFFKSDATSFWTPIADAPDGDEVKLGGAASKISLPRSIYTYTDSASPDDENLTLAVNSLHEDNVAITKTMLGDAAMSDADRIDLLQWARGIDLFDDDADADTTDTRRLMGDPLHSKPLLITYGGTEAAPDITLFTGTNEGYLHAINTADGTEEFAFIPQELLSNLSILFDDDGGTSHPYGLDGPLTSWLNDVNGNGILYDATDTLEPDEHAYLYQGMRRGGKNYYALDVTNRSAPKLKWVITGDTGEFSELGQTWSAATFGKIKLNGTVRNVLFFGGGYDPDQDDNTTAQDDDEGRAIYIVDAETGAKLWQAGPSGTGSAGGSNPDLVLSSMTNSIPADLKVIDLNGDGFKDRIYVGDMRGQIFRFDIDNDGNTGATNLATGGLIAQLGDNTAAGNRRFYYSPDISLSKSRKHLNIAIGSGYRAHPLNVDIHDAFFVIHDVNVHGPALDEDGNPVYTSITMSDLFDTTDNAIGEGTLGEISAAKTSLANSDGFYIWMNEMDNSFVGEKVLANSITFSGQVLFTTYKPISTAGAAGCSPSQGSATVYLVNISDGTPVVDYDLSGSDMLTRSDRGVGLARDGIAPPGSLIFLEESVECYVGTEKCTPPQVSRKPEKTYWHAE